jgi:CubicO group peptidase (beta-lactamase class C family)
MEPTADALHEVFARWARRTRAPGLAWGLVRDGKLSASGGIGTLRIGADVPPDADSVFRIASMTKSFTGAALMRLVARGRVRLDDPVAALLPEIAHWRGPSADGPPLTLRHLVSQESGLPTDDPWADRHMDLSREAMDALLAEGALFGFTPGTAFEYSNLGWALVGRAIERAGGQRVQDVVEESFLRPLGMETTTWTRPPDRPIAEPYRLQDGAWKHEGEPIGDGEIAPMGGLWSSVRDLATWVGFFLDAWPPRDDPDDGPLPRWARREMQQLRRLATVERARPSPNGPSRVVADGYGVGLMIRVDERLGTSVGHSGGLPGYGSHMRWLPERGVGVIALSNVSYGSMRAACVDALEALADRDALGPTRSVRPSAVFTERAEAAARLLSAWSDQEAGSLFAENMAGDEPLDRRAATAAAIVDRHGPIEVGTADMETPLAGSFRSAQGAVEVELGLDRTGRIQWLEVTDRTEPSDAPIVVDTPTLTRLAGSVVILVRPTGDLEDAFERWQGEMLDRIGVPSVVAPAGHATLASFGSPNVPLGPSGERALVEVVERWAASAEPLLLQPSGLGVFEVDPRVVFVRLAAPGVVSALRALRAAAADAGLPPGEAHAIAAEDWVPHLTLALVPADEIEPNRWRELLTWLEGVSAAEPASTATVAEVVTFDGGPGRVVATFPIGRARPAGVAPPPSS